MTNIDAWQQQLSRERFDADVKDYGHTPAGITADVWDTYDRLLDAENRIAPNGDYLNGSATTPDYVLVLLGLSRILLTAEHATIQTRNELPKEADMGTGGLAEVVVQDTNNTAIIPLGRQTSDANYSPKHPIKNVMKGIIEQPENRAHLSLHMLDRGRASDVADKRGYSIMLGIGKEPSEATLELKDRMQTIGSDLDLRVGVNQPHINFDSEHNLRLNEDGSVRTVTFAAAGPNTTRTYSQSLARALGKNDAFAAVQIEINEVLLARQNDDCDFPTDYDRQLGSYLGYLFVRRAAESIVSL